MKPLGEDCAREQAKIGCASLREADEEEKRHRGEWVAALAMDEGEVAGPEAERGTHPKVKCADGKRVRRTTCGPEGVLDGVGVGDEEVLSFGGRMARKVKEGMELGCSGVMKAGGTSHMILNSRNILAPLVILKPINSHSRISRADGS